MKNKIGSASTCCSLFAALLLVLGAIASPLGNARADDPIYTAIFCPIHRGCTTQNNPCSGWCITNNGCYCLPHDADCPTGFTTCCDCI